MIKNKKKTVVLSAIIFAFSIITLGFKKSPSYFKLPKAIKEQFSFVPAGKVFNGTDSVTTGAFYISKYEVSNKDYNEFLAELKLDENQSNYQKAKIDSANWMKEFERAFLEPMAKQYHRHPAYDNYPVVNVTYEGALMYCRWLSQKLNKMYPHDNLQIEVLMPKREEWLRAAAAKAHPSVYSWGGPYLRNAKGQLLCNFKNIGAENVYYDEKSKSYRVSEERMSYVLDEAFFTAPVNSYVPNDFGLYNLNGNVAEMVSEKEACGGSWNSTAYDVRNESVIEFDERSSTVGFRPLFVLTKKS